MREWFSGFGVESDDPVDLGPSARSGDSVASECYDGEWWSEGEGWAVD